VNMSGVSKTDSDPVSPTKLLPLRTLASAMKRATGIVLGAAYVWGPRGTFTVPAQVDMTLLFTFLCSAVHDLSMSMFNLQIVPEALCVRNGQNTASRAC
jgi:hypothetical protein